MRRRVNGWPIGSGNSWVTFRLLQPFGTRYQRGNLCTWIGIHIVYYMFYCCDLTTAFIEKFIRQCYFNTGRFGFSWVPEIVLRGRTITGIHYLSVFRSGMCILRSLYFSLWFQHLILFALWQLSFNMETHGVLSSRFISKVLFSLSLCIMSEVNVPALSVWFHIIIFWACWRLLVGSSPLRDSVGYVPKQTINGGTCACGLW